MDHTLAMYDRVRFETLAFHATIRKLIDVAGYPEALTELVFKPDFCIRGLLVDRARGNLLKVDGHKYVKIAYHGHQRLTKEDRTHLYNRESYRAEEFLSVDTFFALSEVQLFAEIVDFMARHPGRIAKTFSEVYADIRHYIDLCHADGSIKNEVTRHPELYIRRDKYLAPALERLMDAGKTLFLLTNSQYPYTETVMSYLLPEQDGRRWRDYFSMVIVGAGKPGFFTGSQPFYEYLEDTHLLRVTTDKLRPGKIYHGGNAHLLQLTCGFRGDQILYVGDHIYGDIMRSKGLFNWRTLLVVEELDQELPILETLRADLERVESEMETRERQDEELQILRSKLAATQKQCAQALERGDSKKASGLERQIERLEAQRGPLEEALAQRDLLIRNLVEERERKVHPVWGELMKVGLERSRFADQVEDYACLYTSRVSNLRFYSPAKRFISSYDLLPHDE